MLRFAPFAMGLLLLACGNGTASDGTTAAAVGKPSGQQLFNMNCTLCHGRDGKMGLNGAKDLSVSLLTKEEMITVIRQGRGSMMPYKDIFTAKEIDAVVDHVRTLGQAK